jgi:excisionase family DNA binding protein
MTRYLTQSQVLDVCKEWGVPMSLSTLVRMRGAGKIRFTQIGRSVRFTMDDLEAFLKNSRKG